MYEILSVTDEENHAAKSVYGMVSDIVSDLRGVDVSLTESLAGPNDTGITMDLSDEVDNLIRDGNFPFTLEKHLEGYFGESTGSANVTSVRLQEQMNIRQVLETLETTGQIDKALEIVSLYREESDPEHVEILTYALAQYAKGWLAEEIIQSKLEGAKKGSVSQDKGGIDFYLNGDMTQVGSITRYNSKKKQMEESDIRHIVYQWDADGNLHVADTDEILSVNKKIAKEAGLSATLTRRSAGNLKVNKELGRSFRYLWW